LGPLIAYFGLALFDRARWGTGAIASLLSLVALVIAATVFHETRRPGGPPAKEFFSLGRTAAVLRMPTVGLLVLVYFLTIFAMAGFESTLALFSQQAFAMSDDANFLLFAAIGVVLMIAGGAYRPLAKRRPETWLLAAGVAMMIAGMVGLTAVAAGVTGRGLVAKPGDPWRWAFYAAASLAVCGFAFINPSVSALISRRADPDRQGEVLGVNQSFASLGRILGPFAGMTLFSLHVSRVLPYVLSLVALAAVATVLARVTTPAAGRPA
ncbi:MAG: MFS transporter, partial [Planctomycetes bacterium]|nr:MFS transporter [Planctomycetota bacterium]